MGISSLGKTTLRAVLRVDASCVSDCSWRTSRLGVLSVNGTAAGAVKMTFSVFAVTEDTSRANKQYRLLGSFMVVAIEEGRCKG